MNASEAGKRGARSRWAKGMGYREKALKCAACFGRLGFGHKFAMKRLGLSHSTAARFWRANKFQVNKGAAARLKRLSLKKPKPNKPTKGRQIPGLSRRIDSVIAETIAFYSTGLPFDVRQAKKVRDRFRERYRNDPAFNMLTRLRRRLRSFVSGRPSETISSLVGCTQVELIKHIESRFTDGMSWANKGQWQIDHRIPCSHFDLTRKEDRLRCFNWRNLQPLWTKENISKHANICESLTTDEQKEIMAICVSPSPAKSCGSFNVNAPNRVP